MGLRKQLLFWLFCAQGSCAVPLQIYCALPSAVAQTRRPRKSRPQKPTRAEVQRQAAGEAAEKLQMLLPKKLYVMLLRCFEDELRSSPQRLPDAATQRVPRENPSRSSCGSGAHKRYLSDNISGKKARGCIQAASMHAVIKLQSHKDAR